MWRETSELARTGAKREGDVPPGVEVGGRRREMEDDAAHRDNDVGPQFEQPLAQPRHLGVRTRGARGPQPKFLQEYVGRGREEHTQLIGPEAIAACPADLEPVVEFLDPILDVAARTVDGVSSSPICARRPGSFTSGGLSRGSRPASRTTSALMMTRRSRLHVRAA